MDQQPLFFEDVYDAFRHIVRTVGPKETGVALFPKKEQDPSAAARYLADNLNPSRDEKLDLEQIMQLLRMGKEKGCHSAINFICDAIGYSRPTPIEPEDEKAELQREFVATVGRLERIASKLGVNVAVGK